MKASLWRTARIFGMFMFGGSAFLPLLVFAVNAPESLLWQTRYNGVGRDQFNPVVLDTKGNSYVAGYPMSLTKIDPQGQIVWITRLEERSYPAYPVAVTLDRAGNIYVTGDTFQSGQPQNYLNFVTWKFDPNGKLVWRVTYDPPDGTLDYSSGIGHDDDGYLYVAGRSYDWNIAAAYATVLKYDPEGQLLWARRFEAATNSGPNNGGSLAVNPQGGVAIAMSRNVASYSASGELLWSWEGPASEMAAFDGENQLYVLSVYWAGTSHSALKKFSPTGVELWSAAYASPVEGGIQSVDLKVDALGQAYVAADSPISCSLISDDGEVYLRCFVQPLILKYSPSGEQLWATRFSTPTNIFPGVSGLALNSAGEPYLAARLFRYDPMDDGYYSRDGLVAKCDANGNQIWSSVYETFGTGRTLFFLEPAVDQSGNMIVSSELIDYPTSDIDLLLLKFQPFQHRHAPRIASPPQKQIVHSGESVTLNVNATGTGRLLYQWRFNSQPISGATAATLTLPAVQAAQAGDYSVEVRNKFGAVVSPEARLTIQSP